MQDITSSTDATASVEPPPDRYNAAADLLARNVGRAAKLAYRDDDRSLTYGELDDGVRRVAAGLRAVGIAPGERVLIVLHDSVDFPLAFLGALYAGIVPVPVNTLLTAADYAYLLGHSDAKALLVSAPLWPMLAAALASIAGVSDDAGASAASPDASADASVNARPIVPKVVVSGNLAAPAGVGAADVLPFSALLAAAPMVEPATTGAADPAFWLYSSGSTGRPKGAVHTHANLYWTAALYAVPVLGLRESDILFSAAKLYFAYGLGNALTFPLSVGATTVLMAERPTPAAVFERWTRHRISVFFGAPTGYAGMLAAPGLPPRSAVALRLCSSAGEALPRDLGERFTAHFGCEIVDGLGSTEMLHVFLSNRPGAVHYGSTGRVVPGYRLKLVGEDGAAAAPGEIGDLHVAGPSAATMYWNDPERSRATFQGEWTQTGDKYSVDADGHYVYAGRSDDMLKVSGIYVSPFEVEATLMAHPVVFECAVIGVEDADGLTRTKACVVRKPGAVVEAEELQAFVKARLAAYKYPRLIEFLDDLPKTATGKIQRFRLRAAARAQRRGGDGTSGAAGA